MRVIGVDPGIRGAVVVVGVGDAGSRSIIEWHPLERYYGRICGMPLMSVAKTSALMTRLAKHYSPVVTAIERPIVTPSAATKTVSAWSTGAAAAIIASASADAGVEPVLIAPSKWKAKFALIGKDKDDAIDEAFKLFGEFAISGPHYLAIAVAEAALVAITAWEDWRADNQANNN